MTDQISSILSQIRARSGSLGAPALESPRDGSIQFSQMLDRLQPGKTATPGFGETVNRMLNDVSAAQNTSGELAKAFELGDPRADLARVMVSMQQSQVAFKATVEVRNRLVQAYQDVMHMPI